MDNSWTGSHEGSMDSVTGEQGVVQRARPQWSLGGRLGSAVSHTVQYLQPYVILGFLFKLLGYMQIFSTLPRLAGGKRPRLLRWVRATLSSGDRPMEVSEVWKDGSLLCRLVNSTVPSACEIQHRQPWRGLAHGQVLALDLLSVPPAFSEDDLKQVLFTSYMERRLVNYLWQVKEAVEQVKYSGVPTRCRPHRETERHLVENQHSNDCIVKGMGLVAAVQNRRATFYIYPKNQRCLSDLRVEVRGPSGESGSATVPFRPGASQMSGSSTRQSPSCRISIPVSYRVSSSHVRVTYVPRSGGHHQLAIRKGGLHVVGSPYDVHVERCDGSGLVPWKSSSEDEDDDRKVVRKRLRVLLRVVDFVGEKMLLTEDGKLRKVCSVEALYRATRGASQGGRTEVSREARKPQAEVKLRGVELFRDRCRCVINLCKFVLRNSSRQRSLQILKVAERILDGRPIKLHEDTVKAMKLAVEKMAESPAYLQHRGVRRDEGNRSGTETSARQDDAHIHELFTNCVAEADAGTTTPAILQQHTVFSALAEKNCTTDQFHTTGRNVELVPATSQNRDETFRQNFSKHYAKLVPTILEEDEELLYNVTERNLPQPQYEAVKNLMICYHDGSNKLNAENKQTTSGCYTAPEHEATATMTKHDRDCGRHVSEKTVGNLRIKALNEGNLHLHSSMGCVTEALPTESSDFDVDMFHIPHNCEQATLGMGEVRKCYPTLNTSAANNTITNKVQPYEIITTNTNQLHEMCCYSGCMKHSMHNATTHSNTTCQQTQNESRVLHSTHNRPQKHDTTQLVVNIQENEFNLWPLIPEDQLHSTVHGITEAAVDFDSIISAPSLDEALKKLEQGLWKLRHSPTGDKDLETNSTHSSDHTDGTPEPLDQEMEDSPVNYGYPDGDEDNASYGVADSDYVSLDDVRGSLQPSSEDESRSTSGCRKRYSYGAGTPLDGEDSDDRMGPAELEIWGIEESSGGCEPRQDSSYASKRSPTAMPSSRQYPRFVPHTTRMMSITEEIEDYSSKSRSKHGILCANLSTSHQDNTCSSSEQPCDEENVNASVAIKPESQLCVENVIDNDKTETGDNLYHAIPIIEDRNSALNDVEYGYCKNQNELEDRLQIYTISLTQQENIYDKEFSAQSDDYKANNYTHSQNVILKTGSKKSNSERSKTVFVGFDDMMVEKSEIHIEPCDILSSGHTDTHEDKVKINSHGGNKHSANTACGSLDVPDTTEKMVLGDDRVGSTFNYVEIKSCVDSVRASSPVYGCKNSSVPDSSTESQPTTGEISANSTRDEDGVRNSSSGTLCSRGDYKSGVSTTNATLSSPRKRVDPLSPKIKRLGKSLQETANGKRNSKRHPSIMIPGIVSKWRRLFESRVRNDDAQQFDGESGGDDARNDWSSRNTMTHRKLFWEDLLERKKASSLEVRDARKQLGGPQKRNSVVSEKSPGRKMESSTDNLKTTVKSFLETCISDTAKDDQMSQYCTLTMLETKILDQNHTQSKRNKEIICTSLLDAQDCLKQTRETHLLSSKEDTRPLPNGSPSHYRGPAPRGSMDETTATGTRCESGGGSKQRLGTDRPRAAKGASANWGGVVLYSGHDKPSGPTPEERDRSKERFRRARSFFQSLEVSRSPARRWEVPQEDLWKRPRVRRRRLAKGVGPASDGEVAGGGAASSSESEAGGSERRRKVAEKFHVRDLFRDVAGGDATGLKGIPHREAVLAALRSVDDDQHRGGSRAPSPYDALDDGDEDDDVPDLAGFPAPRIPEYQDEYPHLPKTPSRLYQHRSYLSLAGIIPRAELLKTNDGSFAT